LSFPFQLSSSSPLTSFILSSPPYLPFSYFFYAFFCGRRPRFPFWEWWLHQRSSIPLRFACPFAVSPLPALPAPSALPSFVIYLSYLSLLSISHPPTTCKLIYFIFVRVFRTSIQRPNQEDYAATVTGVSRCVWHRIALSGDFTLVTDRPFASTSTPDVFFFTGLFRAVSWV
jgi:hypothetical protein